MTDPDSPAADQPATGRLLVATPELLDPHFAEAVVLLLDHDDDGSLGVVLNRPSPVLVRAVLAGWADSVDPPEVLFEGGPVSPDAALAVACVPVTDEPEPLGFRRLFGVTGIIDLDTPTEVLAPAMTRLRIFAGYAGWSAGQLAEEIAGGSWWVLEATTHDIFAAEPTRLRQTVLRRQRGAAAWLSTRPADPSLN